MNRAICMKKVRKFAYKLRHLLLEKLKYFYDEIMFFACPEALLRNLPTFSRVKTIKSGRDGKTNIINYENSIKE